MMMFDQAERPLIFHDWPHSPHGMVTSRISPGSLVLDIGCAAGYIARELKKKSCKIWGIDIDPLAAHEASLHCEEVSVMDLDKMQSLPFEKNSFDVVLLLDVLEHLARPDRFLPLVAHRITPSPQTQVWISLPNIARVEYRWNLLRGRFNYENGGVMSKGHLRFFTRKTARRLIEESGLKIISEQGTGLASILNQKGFPLFQNFTAFQFLFECVKR